MAQTFQDAIKSCSVPELEAWLRQYERFVMLTQAELATRRAKPVATPLEDWQNVPGSPAGQCGAQPKREAVQPLTQNSGLPAAPRG